MTFRHIDRSALAVDPALDLAATYNRIIKASVARIWENVFDWEHLPVLHDTYFNRVELLERGANGWRVELSKQPGRADRLMSLELRTDNAKTRYRVQTLAGDGAGSEI